MFGSGDKGFGMLPSLIKMNETMRALRSPMDQFKEIINLKNQMKGIEWVTMPAFRIEMFEGLATMEETFRTSLDVTRTLSGFDKVLPDHFNDISKAWKDAMLPISRIVQMSGENILPVLRASVLDPNFQNALSHASQLFETYAKFDGHSNTTTAVRPKSLAELTGFHGLDKFDIAIGTEVLTDTITKLRNSTPDGRSIEDQVKELISPLQKPQASTTPTSLARRKFVSLVIDVVVGLFAGWLQNKFTSAEQDAKEERRQQELINEIRLSQSDIDFLKQQTSQPTYRICVSATFIRLNANAKGKIVARLLAGDVVTALIQNPDTDPKWIYVTFIDQQNCEVSGYALRARFRKE